MEEFIYNFKALGTDCEIIIISKDEKGLNQIINNCYEKIINFENEFSRFKNDSTLSKLNNEKIYKVGSDFLSLVNISKEIFKLTNGYFNPLINVKNIGYSTSFSNNNFELINDLEDLNFDNIKIYGDQVEIQKNMNLDFGSIAKGYLAEKISNFLKDNGYGNNLVNLGGDIFAKGLNKNGEKWKISISSPFDENKEIISVFITNESISTSGTYKRKWEIGDKKYHHIRNPFSNNQEKDLISVTIINDFGYMSDALATAIIAM